MIFVSVGGQKPFPRLCDAVARLVERLQVECIMQTADPEWSHRAVEAVPFVSGKEFDDLILRSSVFVSHAGMGNILAARSHQRRVLILPRRLALGEHRNDHQLDTARALQALPNVLVAWDENELCTAIEHASHSLYDLDMNSAPLPEDGDTSLSIQSALVSIFNNLVGKGGEKK